MNIIFLFLILILLPVRLEAAFSDPIAINSDYKSTTTRDMLAAIGIGHGVEVAVWVGLGANPVNPAGNDPSSQDDGANADLFFSRSTDYGKTWSALSVLKTTAATDVGDDIEPDLATDGQGNWMVVWRSRDPLPSNLGFDPDILMSFSSDDGKTWGPPRPVNNDAATDGEKADVVPHVTTDGQGHWMVSWSIMDPRSGMWDDGVVVAVSSDRGAHWTDSLKVYSVNEYSQSTIVSSLATDNKGLWVATWHAVSAATGGDMDIFYATSTTNGASWSAPAPLNTNSKTDSGGDTFPQLAADGMGNWICTWMSTDTLGGTLQAGSNILFAVSTDNAKSWGAPQAVDSESLTSSNSDSYPRVLTDRHGQWLITWMTRDWGGDIDIAYANSSDLGAHWSTAMPINAGALTDDINEGGGGQAMHLATDGLGHWGVVWDTLDPEGQGRVTGNGRDVMFASLTELPAEAALSTPIAINSDSRATPITNFGGTIGIGHGVEVAVWVGAGANPVNPSGDDPASMDGLNADLFFSRSTDYGKTWSPKAVLKTTAATDVGDDLEPDLATDGQGNWMVVWRSRDPLSSNLGFDPDILMSFSSDDGKTWGPPRPVNNDAATDGEKADVAPHVATDGQGHWMVSWSKMDPRWGTWDDGIAVAVSSDRGAHWSDPQELVSVQEDSQSTIVSSLATDHKGLWVVTWNAAPATTGGDMDIFYATSTTNGASWSAHAPLNTNSMTDSGSDAFPQIATDGMGNWICTWMSTDNLGGTLKGGSYALFAVSADNAKSWSAPKPVNAESLTSITSDIYPRILSDRQGKWLISWMTRGWGGDLDVAYATSSDIGAHWSVAMPVNAGALTDSTDDGGGSLAMHLATDCLGHWGFTWDGLDPQGGSVGKGRDVLFASLSGAAPTAPLTLIQPNGGTLPSGTLLTVQWAGVVELAGTGVKFELWDSRQRLADLGYGWDPSGSGSKQLYLPLVPEGSDFRIRVISTWDSTIYDDSDSSLTIQGGAVRLSWPEGGTIWQTGDREWSWWECNPLVSGTAVRLELWRAGALVAVLGAGWDPNGEGVTQFTVPEVPTATNYKVRVVSLCNESWFVENEGFITIQNKGDKPRSAIAGGSWGGYQ